MSESTSESKYPNHSSLQCSVCNKNSITHSASFQFLFLDDTIFKYCHGNAKIKWEKKPQTFITIYRHSQIDIYDCVFVDLWHAK